jgi:hypothetical protein
MDFPLTSLARLFRQFQHGAWAFKGAATPQLRLTAIAGAA